MINSSRGAALVIFCSHGDGSMKLVLAGAKRSFSSGDALC